MSMVSLIKSTALVKPMLHSGRTHSVRSLFKYAKTKTIGAVSFEHQGQTKFFPVMEGNRVDYQCPETISEQKFLQIIKEQEAQYYQTFKYYSSDLSQQTVFMPASGSLLNFTPTLLSLGASRLICSDITSCNQMASTNKSFIEQNFDIDISFKNQMDAITHSQDLLSGYEASIDTIIFPWFSMYLNNSQYSQLIQNAVRLLKPNGILYERYSSKQAFGVPAQELALKTRFRRPDAIKSFYSTKDWSVLDDMTIQAFREFSGNGQRLLVLKKK